MRPLSPVVSTVADQLGAMPHTPPPTGSRHKHRERASVGMPYRRPESSVLSFPSYWPCGSSTDRTTAAIAAGSDHGPLKTASGSFGLLATEELSFLVAP